MKVRLLASVLVIVTTFIPAISHGRIWRVEKTQPADFRAIQPALDAASPGDSILIGAGRWTECQDVTIPYLSWSGEVFAWVHDSDLTIVGLGPSHTIIGPASPALSDFGPKGLVALPDVDGLMVSGVAFENLYQGVISLSGGPVTITSCRFQGLAYGVSHLNGGNLAVRDCEFQDIDDGDAVHCSSGGPTSLIADCGFLNAYGGIYVSRSHMMIQRCTIDGGVVGIMCTDNSTGVISDCVLRDCENYGIAVHSHTTAMTMIRNTVTGGSCLLVEGFASLTGSENELRGGAGSHAAIVISRGNLNFHGNHLLNGGGYSARLWSYPTAPNVIVDLTNNYWGTSDAAQIEAWIYDFRDDETIRAVVNFNPIAGEPIGVERRSWGQVKTSYRQ